MIGIYILEIGVILMLVVIAYKLDIMDDKIDEIKKQIQK
jgi:hypothetical protein